MANDTLSQRDVEDHVETLGSDEREHLREVAKHDLYVLSKGILGYPDVNPNTHGAFCRFMVSGQGKARRLALMPRGHLKSTIATIADSIRLVLLDPDFARILIANETATTANKFLAEIKGHWEKGALLRQLFPELVPERFSGPGVQWSAEMATINRSTSHKEPSWQAIGVGGAITGSHFTRIKNDDLIGFEAARSAARMAYTLAWNGNIESLLVDQHSNVIDWIGTRWLKQDLYSHVMEVYGESLAVFTRSAIENGEIIFPELHTWEEYTRLQTHSPSVWYAQYENNPLSGDQQELPVEAIKEFKFSLDGEWVILAPGTSAEKRWRVSELDICTLVDPNSGSPTAPDTAAIITTGVTPDDNVAVLDTWSGRPSPSGLVDKVFSVAQRWRPRVVAIEKAGQQSTQHYFEKKSQEASFSVRVQAVAPKNRDKIGRIRDNLEPVIRSGRLHMLPSQTTLRGQIADFPGSPIIDELDALAYGPEVWRKPFRNEDVEKNRAAIKVIMSRRNSVTGY